MYSVLVPGTWFYGFVFAETCGDNKISIARISQLVAQFSISSELCSSDPKGLIELDSNLAIPKVTNII